MQDLESDVKRLEMIKDLTRVEKIQLQRNKLVQLSARVCGDFAANVRVVEHLRELCLQHNRLRALPDALCLLVNVQQLRVDHNELEELPLKLGACMYQLHELHVNNNALKTLPWNLNNLRRLRTLYLHGNKLTYIPNTVAELELAELSYHDNADLDAALLAAPTLDAGLEVILNQKIPSEYKAEVRAVLQLDGRDGLPKSADELLFETLLRNDELLAPFRDFLKKEYALENLLFYERCEQFRLDFNSEVPIATPELHEAAATIFRDFIDPTTSAEHCVNLPARIVQPLRDALSERGLTQRALDAARQHVFKTMFTDIFPRFRHAPEARKTISRGKKIVARWLQAGGIEADDTNSMASL